MRTFFLSSLFFLFFITTSQAQKSFEGKITFTFQHKGEKASELTTALSGMIYQFKGADIRFEMIGAMASDFRIVIFKGKERVMYLISDNEKKAYKKDMEEDTENTIKTMVTKEDEVIEIAGYKCQKHKVVSTDQNQNQDITYIWAAKDIKVAKPQDGKLVVANYFNTEGVEGFPLKIISSEIFMDTELTTNITATEVSTKKLKKTIFTVPKGYLIEDITPKGNGLYGQR